MEAVLHFLREGINPILVALDMTKAFNKYKFCILFGQIANNISPAVTRALIYVYQMQNAWTRWGNSKSEEFGITNGEAQGKGRC